MRSPRRLPSSQLGLALVPLGPIFPQGKHMTRADRHRKWEVLGKRGALDIHQKTQLLVSQVGKGPCTYANFLIYEMSGHLDLLRDPPDGEYSQVGVGVGRGVPLKLHVGA